MAQVVNIIGSILDSSDTTKSFSIDFSTVTSGTSASLKFSQAGNAVYTFPSGTSTLVSENGGQTISSGSWNASIINPTYGGTGVNNGSNTITLGGNLITSGAFPLTFTTTGPTNITFPTSGTLLTSASAVSSITGTASQIDASSSVGNITLSLPNPINVNTTGSAATLTTSRNINGVSFNGSADITVTAAAGTLTGTTLNGTVTGSSLISLGTITTGVWNGTAISETSGGTGQTTWTTGDIPYSSASDTISKLPIGTAGKVLTVTAGIPSWSIGSGVLKQYVATAGLTQTNPGAATFATLFSGTAAGTLTIPANTFIVGTMLFFTISGIYSTGTPAPTGTVRVLLGGSVVATSSAITLVASRTNVPYILHGVITCRTDGVSGTFAGSIDGYFVTGAAPAGTNVMIGSTTTATTTLNTTGSLTLNAQFAFSTANASHAITAVSSFVYLSL